VPVLSRHRLPLSANERHTDPALRGAWQLRLQLTPLLLGQISSARRLSAHPQQLRSVKQTLASSLVLPANPLNAPPRFALGAGCNCKCNLIIMGGRDLVPYSGFAAIDKLGIPREVQTFMSMSA